mgnify:FL=1
MAILAVLLDHTYGYTYTNVNVWSLSYYSVSLFVIIAGFLSYSSNKKHEYSYVETVLHSCKKIVPAYVLATALYQISDTNFFDFETFVLHLVHFDATGQFYYVALYMQLMLVSPLLYKIVICFPKDKSLFYESLLGILLICISYVTIRYTNILDIFGGGGILFGGTYLVLFYMGMIIKANGVLDSGNLMKYAGFAVCGGILFWNWYKVIFCEIGREKIDSLFPFGYGWSPPSISFSVQAICMLVFCFGVFNILNAWRPNGLFIKLVNWNGKHTLYVFLYHRLILCYILDKLNLCLNTVTMTMIYILTMILGSVLIEYFLKVVKSKLKSLWSMR